MSTDTDELKPEVLGHLVASDSSLIGLMIAARYLRGGDGVRLARDIRDVIHAIRKEHQKTLP